MAPRSGAHGGDPGEGSVGAGPRGLVDRPHLAAAFDSFAPPNRQVDQPLRMPVADVARVGRKGVVLVGGKLEGGALRPGTRVFILPSGQLATVK